MTAFELCVRSLALSLAVVALGCGGAPKEPATADDEGVAEEDSDTDGREAVQIEGLLGTIAREDVERVVEARNDAVIQCYQQALDVSEQIEGNLEVVLEVGADGKVTRAHLRNGTLGSREAESCIVSLVRRMVFPKPQGGSHASVVYPLALVKPYDDPAPEAFPAQQMNEVLAQGTGDVERCLGGETGVQLTVYVGPKGAVVSAGATSDRPETYERAQCLAAAAESWKFPPMGRNGGKAIFPL